MKRILLLSISILLSFASANAQDEVVKEANVQDEVVTDFKVKKVRYQGDAQLGFSFGVGDYIKDRANIHTVHGIRVGKYFSTGIGFGIDMYTDNTISSFAVPVFLNLTGYLPVSPATSLFLSVDAGYSLGICKILQDWGGILVAGAVGVAFDVGDRNGAVTISLGYNHQQWAHPNTRFFKAFNADAVSFKIGYSF